MGATKNIVYQEKSMEKIKHLKGELDKAFDLDNRKVYYNRG